MLENPVVLSCCLLDESEPLADRAMRRVIERSAAVSGIWRYELRNALVMNEPRGKAEPRRNRGNAGRSMSDAYQDRPSPRWGGCCRIRAGTQAIGL